jgi:CheY-like chemotaxis protein
VSDDGHGFDPARATELFEPFAQGDTSLARATTGLGLGLPIVRNAVELHGGRVLAHSDGPGCGARFTIELPTASPHPVNHPDHDEVVPTGRSGQVLVIEDNPDVASACLAMLHQLGHTGSIEDSGHGGLEKAAATLPDAVLCDIGLPDIDGYEVARRLRGGDRTAHIPLLAVSGYGQPADLQRSRRAGFDDHLVKPISRDALARALASVLSPAPP